MQATRQLLFTRWASKTSTQPDRRAKVGSVVRVPINLLYHSVSVPVASAIAVSRCVIHIPDFLAIRAIEETKTMSASHDKDDVNAFLPVVSWPKIVVSRGEDRTRLGPAGTQRWVAAAVPGQQPQAVLRSPTVACRVGEIGLAAVVHCSSALHDRSAILLPALRGRRKDFGCADLARRGEWCDAERLKLVGHAGPDEEVAPFAEAHDAAVDAPNIRQRGEVGVGLKWIRATCDHISIFWQTNLSGSRVTLKNVRTLQVQVGAVASGVVDVPHTIEVMELRLWLDVRLGIGHSSQILTAHMLAFLSSVSVIGH